MSVSDKRTSWPEVTVVVTTDAGKPSLVIRPKKHYQGAKLPVCNLVSLQTHLQVCNSSLAPGELQASTCSCAEIPEESLKMPEVLLPP